MVVWDVILKCFSYHVPKNAEILKIHFFFFCEWIVLSWISFSYFFLSIITGCTYPENILLLLLGIVTSHLLLHLLQVYLENSSDLPWGNSCSGNNYWKRNSLRPLMFAGRLVSVLFNNPPSNTSMSSSISSSSGSVSVGGIGFSQLKFIDLKQYGNPSLIIIKFNRRSVSSLLNRT